MRVLGADLPREVASESSPLSTIVLLDEQGRVQRVEQEQFIAEFAVWDLAGCQRGGHPDARQPRVEAPVGGRLELDALRR